MNTKDIECPYCEAQQDINHDDGYGYEEGETHQQECDNCGKIFVYETSISFYYSAEQADCLNGGEHKWKPTITVPKEYTKMRCGVCDERRDLTEVEKELYLK